MNKSEPWGNMDSKGSETDHSNTMLDRNAINELARSLFYALILVVVISSIVAIPSLLTHITIVKQMHTKHNKTEELIYVSHISEINIST